MIRYLVLLGFVTGCGDAFESDLFVASEGGLGGSAGAAGSNVGGAASAEAGGTAGSVGGSAGAIVVDGAAGAAGSDAGVPTCACETMAVEPGDKCAPSAASASSCGAVGKETCLKCNEACGRSPVGASACVLNVGVGSEPSDPTHSWWCCA